MISKVWPRSSKATRNSREKSARPHSAWSEPLKVGTSVSSTRRHLRDPHLDRPVASLERCDAVCLTSGEGFEFLERKPHQRRKALRKTACIRARVNYPENGSRTAVWTFGHHVQIWTFPVPERVAVRDP